MRQLPGRGILAFDEVERRIWEALGRELGPCRVVPAPRRVWGRC